ncbi:hypothetical protein VB711_16390 [Cronbergia sp. UHCC 0137]|uniref:hypothetical protein n=1 Tax=Cronbergia sp. UHCC 0137 TaxID=3110239 RepID=UPI002B20C40F|nr:hypothetical protein [Cronbergia sp. UHCC 0137]MEA5619409.1 hypothetical protein [Cronbergia sp. UHCC 0137]
MFNQVFLAQSSGSKTKRTTQEVVVNDFALPDLGLIASGGLVLALIGVTVYSKILMNRLEKKIRFEKFRTRELDKKVKLALETIRKMETNPDLVHSRDFNLEYLRLRMSEEVFHFAIVNQVKVRVKDRISQALRPSQSQQGQVGIASNAGKQVDEIFDVEYETGVEPNIVKRVLFRIQIRLMKLPTQTTSVTISQIIECIETYLSPMDDEDNWQPTIQGRIVNMHWDQKAKPTPLLVMEQLNQGVNVTFRTNRKPTIPAASQFRY